LFTAIIATSPFWLLLLTSRSGVQPPLRRVAVLPFLGAESPENDRILEELAGAVATEISRYRRLETVPFQESRTLKAKQSDLRRVAHDLGIDFIVTGAMLRVKEDLHLKIYLAAVQRPNLPFWLQDYPLPGGKPGEGLSRRIASDIVRAASNFR